MANKDDGYAEGKEVAQKLGQLVNVFGRKGRHNGFIEQLISYEHPTLQQAAFSLFLKWAYRLAEVEHGDLRNEAARNAAKKIKAALGEHGDDLPFI